MYALVWHLAYLFTVSDLGDQRYGLSTYTAERERLPLSDTDFPMLARKLLGHARPTGRMLYRDRSILLLFCRLGLMQLP